MANAFSDVMSPVLTLKFLLPFTVLPRTDFNLAAQWIAATLARFMVAGRPICGLFENKGD